ncbi:sensor histidine kinase [Myxococcus qinghaiensis]|uniref:sensor histidine kinase n=1 Tax=Myxococcus qinghaiensis TaxID=2906758 RepID=UPI0020A81EF3|nr:ATP-binding protein [Myxococcus qinghaiensis]MCP3161889.1 HAMP domain-containing histidine kinase [Myxococcus qinghaiensis]
MKLRLRLALTAMAAVLPVVVAMAYFQQSLRDSSQEEVLEASTLAQMQVERTRCEAAPETWRPRPSERPAPPGRPPGPDDDGRPPPPPRRLEDGEAWPPRGKPPPPGASDMGEGRPPRDPGRPPRPGGGPDAFNGPPPPRAGGEDFNGPPPLGPDGRAPPRVVFFPYDTQLTSRNPRAPALTQEMREDALAGATVARRSEQDGRRVLELLVRMPWDDGPCAFVLARRVEPPGPSSFFLPPLKDWSLLVSIVVAAVVLALGPVVRRIRMLTEDVRASARSGYEQPVSVRGDDEVADLARAFQEARAEIQSRMAQQEAREQGLRDFLANTTHDVMTPLTVLQGNLSAMQQRVSRGEPVNAAEVASAMSEAHYMASLVHNLTAATRLEAGALHVQRAPVDLNDVIARVLGRHQPIARQQRISLESGVPATPVRVLGDVTLIEQAVSNVVGNGVRYGREDGHVAVVLESTRAGRFALRVIDDGPGIPDEERARILERGVRGSVARTRAPEGQGLGLHIAHHVAQVHGWTLTLSPSEYGGLEVCFSGETLATESPPETAQSS